MVYFKQFRPLSNLTEILLQQHKCKYLLKYKKIGCYRSHSQMKIFFAVPLSKKTLI